MQSSQIIYILLLIATALLSGLIALRITSGKRTLGFFMVFTGGYLFSITIVHILPEIYQADISMFWVGVLILAGFFLQQLLEFFTSGIEHGHIHELSKEHSHSKSSAPVAVFALSLHALLEGSILNSGNMDTLLLGILLHKGPAAFALISVLRCSIRNSRSIIIWLIVFTLASPMGILLGNLVGEAWMIYLMALVAGNFLQISTTIVFENTADHKFNIKKLTYSLFGAVLAVISELLIL